MTIRKRVSIHFMNFAESSRDAHGAYRQVWFQKFSNEKIATLKRNVVFQQPVADLYEMVYDFESFQINSAEHYGQRITAYLQVC